MAMNELSGLKITTSDGDTVLHLRDSEVNAIDELLKMRNPHFKDKVDVLYKHFNEEYETEDNKLYKDFIREIFGSYYHVLSKELLNKRFIFRYLYLNTYTDYSGYIKLSNIITNTRITKIDEDGERVYSEHRYCKKSDLKYIFSNMTDKPLKEVVDYFINNKMMEIDKNGYIFIPKAYAIRGTIKREKLLKCGGARMFDIGIKDLYEKTNVKEHSKIDYIFKLIPYVNFHHNIICKNPKEESIDKVIPLKQKDILEILNITKPTSVQLVKLKILDESLFCKISNAYVTNAYVINPKFFYMGGELEYADRLRGWFLIGKNPTE